MDKKKTNNEHTISTLSEYRVEVLPRELIDPIPIDLSKGLDVFYLEQIELDNKQRSKLKKVSTKSICNFKG